MSVAAIIPAFNEEKTIKQILEIIKTSKYVDEIIVVNDGSTDRTSDIARSCGVRVIDLKENIGKGGAMAVGASCCKEDIILFLDADLVGLRQEHIENLVVPLLRDEADMSLGFFSNGRITTDLSQLLLPKLTGQRAIKKEIFTKLDYCENSRFGIEIALNSFIKKNNYRIKNIKLKYLTHVMKEEKMGFIPGLVARFKMYWEIVRMFTLVKCKRWS